MTWNLSNKIAAFGACAPVATRNGFHMSITARRIRALFFLPSHLTASEIFPLETRALAIACFYALGTAIGGSILLIESGSAWRVSFGYGIAARADARGPY